MLCMRVSVQEATEAVCLAGLIYSVDLFSCKNTAVEERPTAEVLEK